MKEEAKRENKKGMMDQDVNVNMMMMMMMMMMMIDAMNDLHQQMLLGE